MAEAEPEITVGREIASGGRRSGALLAAILILILALAAYLRWHSITARGFFFDELWIAELSSGHGSAFTELPLNELIEQPNTVALGTALPAWTVAGNITGAIHPPATFVMLRLWREVFGDSMLALRSFSAAWSTLVVLLTFVAARLSFGSIAGVGAALISALSLANIDQAQDVRGYTMLQALLLLTVIALLKMRGRASCWPGAFAVAIGTLLMMYTHYFAAGACAAVAVGAIILLPRRTRWQTLGLMTVAGIIWTITWLPQLRAQLAFVPATADVFLADRTQFPLGSTLLRLLTAPYRALVAEEASVNLRSLVGGLVVLYLLGLRFSSRSRSGEAKLVVFWLAIVGGVVGQLLLLDLARTSQHLEYMKYVLPANPALCVLIGSLVIWRRWLTPAAVCVALGVLIALTPLPRKRDLRPHVAYLKTRASANDLFILPTHASNPTGAQATYLFVAQGLPWPRHNLFLQVGPASPDLVASLPRNRRWFYFAFDRTCEPTSWLPGTRIIDAGPGGDAAVWELGAGDAMPASHPSSTQHAR